MGAVDVRVVRLAAPPHGRVWNERTKAAGDRDCGLSQHPAGSRGLLGLHLPHPGNWQSDSAPGRMLEVNMGNFDIVRNREGKGTPVGRKSRVEGRDRSPFCNPLWRHRSGK